MSSLYRPIVIGNNRFENTPCALGIRLPDASIRPLLHVHMRERDGKLLLFFDAVDETGARIQVRKNQLLGADATRGELHHLPGQTRLVNGKTGRVILEIRHHEGLEIYGNFLCEGIRIIAAEGSLTIGKLKLSGHCLRNLGGILLYPATGFVANFLGSIPLLPHVHPGKIPL